MKESKTKILARKNRSFRQAMKQELREHPTSFRVYSVLRLLAVVSMVRQVMLHNYEGAFLCLVTLLLFYIPSIIKLSFHVDIPPTLEIIVFCFIFAGEILGEVNAFFIKIPFWDSILHTITGFLAAAVGFSLVTVLNNNRNLQFSLSPFFMALVAFTFSMTIGALWEFYEFISDWFLHTDMQKDTIVHAIYSVMLDPTNSNKVVGITGITDTMVNGQNLGFGGYLDIGLVDTMEDMFVNFVGALTFSVFGYFYAKSKGERDSGISRIVLTPKEERTDYYRQALEENTRLDEEKAQQKAERTIRRWADKEHEEVANDEDRS